MERASRSEAPGVPLCTIRCQPEGSLKGLPPPLPKMTIYGIVHEIPLSQISVDSSRCLICPQREKPIGSYFFRCLQEAPAKAR